MTKNNYKIIKEYLDANWEKCEILMFNCQFKDKKIQPWLLGENTFDIKKSPALFVQNDLDSFQQSYNNDLCSKE